MSVPTFPCPSGETCFAPECCAHGMCMHMAEAEQQQPEPAAAPEPTDTEIIDFMENQARSIWGSDNAAWSLAMGGTPSYCTRDEDLFTFDTIRDSVKAAMVKAGWKRQAPQETPLAKCTNAECPVGCPDSHAATPAYFAMVDAEPADEPVVQEVNRG